MARFLGFAVLAKDPAIWVDGTRVLVKHLSPDERLSLAYCAMLALPKAGAEAVATATVPATGAGRPVAPFGSVLDEAAFWADLAEPDELDAYCLACFKAMSRDRKAAFLAYAQEKVA
jgi:hypothetical protein